jgi:hypothetical protein
VVNALPLSGSGADGTFLLLDRPDQVLDLEDFERLLANPEVTGYAEYRVASEGYFQAMGIPLVAGRLFDGRDAAESPHVALVSRSLAERRWPAADPIDRQIQYGNMDGDLRPLTIVGIVGDVHQGGLDTPPEGTIYVSHRQRPQGAQSFTFVVAHGGEREPVLAAARGFARELAPEMPLRFHDPADLVAAALGPQRLSLVLLGFFAGAALLLAAAGAYGAVAYAVAQRTREIGLRLALGAGGRDVVLLALRQGMRPAAAGLAAWILATLGAARSIESLLYGVRPADPVALVGAAGCVATVALVACYLPARRAARVEPLVALRYD